MEAKLLPVLLIGNKKDRIRWYRICYPADLKEAK